MRIANDQIVMQFNATQPKFSDRCRKLSCNSSHEDGSKVIRKLIDHRCKREMRSVLEKRLIDNSLLIFKSDRWRIISTVNTCKVQGSREGICTQLYGIGINIASRIHYHGQFCSVRT